MSKISTCDSGGKGTRGRQLRHHRRIVMKVMEAGARTERQVFCPADHTRNDTR